MKKTIQIQNITLNNFKGAKNLTINFDPNLTDIFGDNGTGKTTIFDAFTWLLFGKDSTNRKDFEVKPLDKYNQTTEKVDVEVSASLLVDGVSVSLRRVLRENWVKPRGAEASIFKGNETLYYWNDVPMQQKEFQIKIGDILEEDVFKRITSPYAFNDLSWQERRSALVKMVGEVSDEEIAGDNIAYQNLVSEIRKYGDLNSYRKMIAESVKKAKDEIKLIPTRIDEVVKGMPGTEDFEAIRLEVADKQMQVDEIQSSIDNKAVAYNKLYENRAAEQNTISKLKGIAAGHESDAKTSARRTVKEANDTTGESVSNLEKAEAELKEVVSGLSTLEVKKKGLSEQIESLEYRIRSKRQEWETENAVDISLSEDKPCCPTCGREFDASYAKEKRETTLANFRTEKQKKLSTINSQGLSLKNEIESLKSELSALQDRIDKGTVLKQNLEKQVVELREVVESKKQNLTIPDENELYKTILADNTDYAKVISEIETLEQGLTVIPTVDNAELTTQKNTLLSEISQLNARLSKEAQIKSAEGRISELKAQEKKLAEHISGVEKTQFTVESFNRAKIESLEERINQKFKFVRFKMFEQQINGGETEICEALINGVPFQSANTASKINAGIDIINTLCDFYQVSAPIFIDGRESIVKLIDSDSQIVNLIVYEGSELSVGKPSNVEEVAA